ncbi:MAG TPA: HD domain-containing protein [Candidatus Portnoybacteria bacterium]|nr:HD domain-containing protein [Candidatus Portnoybacteria bacterium]
MIIPSEVKNILTELQKAGFEAFAVGGCVRDLMLGRKPKDWDVATNATPEQVQKIFPASFYENKFGTVSVKTDSAKDNLKIIEITTYRVDAPYSDKRHPDEVSFTPNLKEDLARRDFTINALALGLDKKIIDPFGGQEDLAKGLIRAVGEAEKRFNEDALRMLRAVRFFVELVSPSSVKQSFSIEKKTQEAIKKNALWLQAIAKERIRDEFEKIIMSESPSEGVLLLHELGLLQYIIPELEKGWGVAQNKHHIYSIFEHGIFSLKFAAQKKYNLVVRLAALLHDVAKPQAKRGEGPEATFYNHDIMGARAAARILERLHFSNEIIERVANIIRHHMFVYDVGAVTAAAVRRLLVRVGPENIDDLIALRVADRLGSGVPKAQPYRLRHFQYMVERVQSDPISVKMLKINGHDLMSTLQIKPGPKIGAILDVLLAEVIEEPTKNTKEKLSARAGELDKEDLAQLRQMAKARIEEEKEEEDKIIKGRYWV